MSRAALLAAHAAEAVQVDARTRDAIARVCDSHFDFGAALARRVVLIGLDHPLISGRALAVHPMIGLHPSTLVSICHRQRISTKHLLHWMLVLRTYALTEHGLTQLVAAGYLGAASQQGLFRTMRHGVRGLYIEKQCTAQLLLGFAVYCRTTAERWKSASRYLPDLASAKPALAPLAPCPVCRSDRRGAAGVWAA